MEEVERQFYGIWKICCLEVEDDIGDPLSIEGTEFHLDESGDVHWTVKDGIESLPFFSCETYELALEDPPMKLTFLDSSGGAIMTFQCQLISDTMVLMYNKTTMHCSKVTEDDSSRPFGQMTYSLLPALEEGFFADMSIRASDSSKIPCHSTILSACCPFRLGWDSSVVSPLSGLPRPVLQAALHFIYSDCLPSDVTEATVKKLRELPLKLPGLKGLEELCGIFLQSTAVQQKISRLLLEVQVSVEQITVITNCGQPPGSLDSLLATVPIERLKCSRSYRPVCPSTSGQPAFSDPSRLYSTLKTCLREGAVAAAKLVLISTLYNDHKLELTRDERKHLIQQIRTHVSNYLDELCRLAIVMWQQFSPLTQQQRAEIGAYFVPEVETVWDTVSKIGVDIRAALDQVIRQTDDRSKRKNKGINLGQAFRKALHARELIRMKKLQEKLSSFFSQMFQKREEFRHMTDSERVRAVTKGMQFTIDEVTTKVVLQTKEILDRIAVKMQPGQWKFLFKFVTSRLSWAHHRVLSHREHFSPLINTACDYVHREDFSSVLKELQLIDDDVERSHTQPSESATACASGTPSDGQLKKLKRPTALSATCLPPISESHLPRYIGPLLTSGALTDMSFEIRPCQQDGQQPDWMDVTVFPAHRCIVAARCSWLRRALQSGMIEDISRKVTLSDVNPELFKLFLEFLYCGTVNMKSLSAEQIADLLVFSDQYESDDLKVLCEIELRNQLDDESAMSLLNLADQYSARTLRAATLQYVMEHSSLLQSEQFAELSEALQTEVTELVHWSDSAHVQNPGDVIGHAKPHSLKGSMQRVRQMLDEITSSSSSSSDSEGDSNSQPFHAPPGYQLNVISDSEVSETGVSAALRDDSRLTIVVAQLREIIGGDAAQEQLEEVAIAADYDVNRAVNYFFSL